jgi:hypothetical protein
MRIDSNTPWFPRRAVLLMALPIGALAAWPERPSGQDTILFRADYSQAAYPNLGWGANESKYLDKRFTRAYLPKGGPDGQPAVRLSALPCAGCSYSGGQYNWGWRADLTPADPPENTSRFYRWRMRFTPETNQRGLDWEEGTSRGMQNKLLIVGQDCGDGCRFILSYQTEADGREIRNFRIQKDGGEDLEDTRSYPHGQWLHVQVELLVGDARGKGGAYRLWVNSNAQRSPTAERKNITLRGANHKHVCFGAFMNEGLAAGGVHAWDHTDFEVGTTFDPAWTPAGAKP